MDGLSSHDRAALVTGACSEVGEAIAALLCEERHAVTLVSPSESELETARARLVARGHHVHVFMAHGSDEEVRAAVAAHGERFGRLDVLVNGCETRSAAEDPLTVRSMMAFYREALPLLAAAGREHGNALVLNTAAPNGSSVAMHAAAKQGVLGFTNAMNQELHSRGIKSCAFVVGHASDGSEPIGGGVRPSDVAEMVRALLRLSPWCVVPELVFTAYGQVAPA